MNSCKPKPFRLESYIDPLFLGHDFFFLNLRELEVIGFQLITVRLLKF